MAISKRKPLLFFAALTICIAPAHSQGLMTMIKKKIEKKKEAKMSPEERAALEQQREEKKKKEETEKLEAAVFPPRRFDDPGFEKLWTKNLPMESLLKNKLNGAKVEIIHGNFTDWKESFVMDRDPYGYAIKRVTLLYMIATIGFRNNGKCYMMEVYIHRDALGGGQFSKNGNLDSYNEPVEIYCDRLDAAIAADKAEATGQ